MISKLKKLVAVINLLCLIGLIYLVWFNPLVYPSTTLFAVIYMVYLMFEGAILVARNSVRELRKK